MSANEANPTDLELLRQRISELESKNAKLEAGLEKKNVELEERRLSVDHLMKQINELKDENIKRDTENAELKVRVEKLEQGSSVEQPQNEQFKSQAVDVPNTVVDLLEDAKLEQNSSVVNEQSQDAEDGKVFLLKGFARGAFSKKGASGDQSNNANTKLTENDPINAFLIEQHKKSVGEEIRQRNREKKLALQGELQRESTAQETPGLSALSTPGRTPSVSQNTASVTS